MIGSKLTYPVAALDVDVPVPPRAPPNKELPDGFGATDPNGDVPVLAWIGADEVCCANKPVAPV